MSVARCELVLPSFEELLLLRPDLLHVQFVESGIAKLLNPLKHLLLIGTTGKMLRNAVLGDECRCRLEITRFGKCLWQTTRQEFVAPQPVRGRRPLFG